MKWKQRVEKPITKFFLTIFIFSAIIWLGAGIMKNIQIEHLIEFGTVQFKQTLVPEVERAAYNSIAEYSIVVFISYPIALFFGIGYIVTTRRTFKEHGWLLMSAILFFIFVPVELYSFVLDWKIVGLNYTKYASHGGSWELEEFRKAFLLRLNALAGLPFIAQLCYYTIPFLVIFKPFKKPA